jgi:hypothetical protein
MGVVGVVGGEVFTGGNRQLLPRRKHRIIRQVNRYFVFSAFIDKLLTLHLVIIAAKY